MISKKDKVINLFLTSQVSKGRNPKSNANTLCNLCKIDSKDNSQEVMKQF